MSADTPHSDDPLTALQAWLRDEDEPDAPSGEVMSDERMAELTERAMTQGRARIARRQWARRRRQAVVAATAVAMLAGGGAVAAAILRSQPDSPHTGTTCRAEAAADADAIVVQPGGDPVARCREVWDSGAFEEHGIEVLPDRLTACVSSGGGIDVFPGEETVCSDLGLEIAETELAPDNQAIVALHERLIAEINEPGCLSATEAQMVAREILDDLGYTDWPVEVNADATGTTCAKAAVGPDNHHVFIFKT